MANYAGYLIQVGNYKIPHKFIQASSYKITYYSQDLDSYRDADGILHRQVLSSKAPKVEFNVVPMLDADKLQELLSNLRNQFNSNTERKASCIIYIPETDEYRTTDMYMVDPSIEVYFADKNEIKYKSFRLAFVSYGVRV